MLSAMTLLLEGHAPGGSWAVLDMLPSLGRAGSIIDTRTGLCKLITFRCEGLRAVIRIAPVVAGVENGAGVRAALAFSRGRPVADLTRDGDTFEMD